MLRIIPLAVSTSLIVSPSALAEGLSPSSRDTFERSDDIVLPVSVTAGSCPSEIRFWQEYNPHMEAGDSLGLMLDVATLSRGKTEFIDSQEHSVTFRTPLAPQFYSCVANLGNSDQLDDSARHYRRLYDIWFEQGYVYFHFDVSPIAPAPEEDWYFAGITHQEIVGQYPYVRWIVAD